MAKSKVTNISAGPRGAYLDGQLVMADPGQEIEADDFNDEWFAKSSDKSAKAASAAADAGEVPPSPTAGMTKAELVEYAAGKGITIDADGTKADILAQIELAGG